MEYTSFAIAVIESIWPHPDGYDYMGKADKNSQDEQTILGMGAKDVVGQTFHEESTEPSGWYKVVPLNITSFKTQATTSEGNNWSVTFTADDMLLVQTGKSGKIEGNALISEIIDSLREASIVPGGSVSISDLVSKNPLSNLPYAARRVSLRDNLFNLQDLVIPGDTLSIWYYNDPSEFFPFEAVQQKLSSTVNIEADFHEVIGSGDRRGQFKTSDDQYASEFKLGLDNYVYSAAIKKAKGDGNGGFEIKRSEIDLMALTTVADATRVIELGGEDINVIVAASASEAKVNNTEFLGATTRNPNGLFTDQLAWFLTVQYPDKFAGYTKIYKSETSKPDKGWGRPSGIAYQQPTSGRGDRVAIQYYLISLFRDAANLQNTKDADVYAAAESGKVDAVIKAKAAVIEKKGLESNPTRPPQLEPESDFNPTLYITGRNLFADLIKSKVEQVSKTIKGDDKISQKNNVNSVIKRKTLSSKNFGENSYLVMKGHIQGVSTSRSASAQTITINGSGLEYPLTKHLVFFDTLTDILSSNGYLQDYRNGSLVSMNPAQQMLFLITKYAPKQIRWGPVSSNDNISRQVMHISTVNGPVKNLIPAEAFNKNNVLKRGNLIIDRDPALYEELKKPVNERQDKEGIPESILMPYARMFTPLTHYSLYRLGESLRAFLAADPSGELGNTAFPHQIEDRTPVLQMIKQIAGAQNIMEFFVDSNGYMIYRVAAEAWERTPRPEYTPTIEEDTLLNLNFSESDDNVVTLVDVTMQQMSGMGNATTSATQYHFGRGLARVNPLPLSYTPAYTRMDTLKNTLSPEFFRYGLRYQGLTDVYGGTTSAARDKANTIYRFYGSPVKRAEVTVIGNPSYRAGDTVLLTLPTHKKRLKKRLKISTMLTWMKNIQGSSIHTKMYVGDEGRLKNPQYYTNPGFNLGNESLFGLEYLDKPQVLSKFIRTIEWMRNVIGDVAITWDMFPTTLWWYLDHPENGGSSVVDAYKLVLRGMANQKSTYTPKELEIIQKYLPLLRFNNFMCMSFYIDGVSHSYEFNSASTTTLTLSYGQENICLISPTTGSIVGFFSVDRRIRDLFPGAIEDFEIKNDGMWRKLFAAQFNEDLQYKAGSFVYQSSEVRNTSNYLHTIASRFGKVFDDNYNVGG